MLCAPMIASSWPSVFYLFAAVRPARVELATSWPRAPGLLIRRPTLRISLQVGFVWCGLFGVLATSTPETHACVPPTELQAILCSLCSLLSSPLLSSHLRPVSCRSASSASAAPTA